MTQQETRTAANKRPIVPSGGYFDTPFDARMATQRLTSRRSAPPEIVACFQAILSSPKAVRTSPVLLSSCYQLMGNIGTPKTEDMPLLSSLMEALPTPTDREIADALHGDGTARMTALVMMSSKTPDSIVDGLAKRHNLRSGLLATDLASRTRLIDSVIEANNSGIELRNERLATILVVIMQQERWLGTVSKVVINGLNSFPHSMVTTIVANAPRSIVNSVIGKEMTSTRSSRALLDVLMTVRDKDEAVNAVVRFMTDADVPDQEKIALYEFLVVHGDTGAMANMPEVKINGMRAFAANDSQATFDYALEAVSEGRDTVSIGALTGNFDYSLHEFVSIIDMLRRLNKMNEANPQFAAAAEATMSASDVSDEDIDSFIDRDFGDGVHIASVRWNEMEWPDEKKPKSGVARAVMLAAFLVALGIPLSIALSRTNTTPKQFAEQPEAIRIGTAAAKSSNPATVQRVREMANQTTSLPSPTPPAKPPSPAIATAKPATVSRQLVDTVVMLEHDPNKEISYKGAGGLMQLMPKTWEEINQKYFGGKYPFAQYHTNDWVNRRFGTIYLQEIKDWLDDHRAQWKTDQTPLILACYHGGIGNIMKANFDPIKIQRHMPETYDYMVRGSNVMGQSVRRIP